MNAKDKKEALEKLWSDECWDDKALSFWKLEYEKASAKEGEKLHVNNNMLNGFIQRMDDKVRKHSLGCFGVYGDEPNLDQKGLMLWRGTEVPGVLKDHPSMCLGARLGRLSDVDHLAVAKSLLPRDVVAPPRILRAHRSP